jgi:hypothetical protein
VSTAAYLHLLVETVALLHRESLERPLPELVGNG